MAATPIWILDGHNMIFAIPGLERLQISGRREEARRGLVDRLRRFAHARGEQVLIVFDGNDLESNPDAIQEPLLEVVYARRGEGEADDRIIHRARTGIEQRQSVTVVTNDVRTVARELPDGVRHLEVRRFWRKYILQAGGPGGKRVEGDFSDLEHEMVARAAAAEGAARSSTRSSGVPGPTGKKPGAASADESLDEPIHRKRERGRLRQARRLKRRSVPGRLR